MPASLLYLHKEKKMDDTKAIRRTVHPGRIQIWFYALGGLAILVGAYFLIVEPISAPPGNPPQAVSATNSKSRDIFEHKDFTVAQPAGWAVLDEEELSKESDYFAHAIRHLNPGALVTVKVEKRDTNDVSIDQLAIAISEKLAGQFDEFKELDSRILTTESGHQALVYDYLFTVGPDSNMRQVLYVVLSKSKAYYVAAQAKTSDFEAVQTDIDKVLSSFSPQ